MEGFEGIPVIFGRTISQTFDHADIELLHHDTKELVGVYSITWDFAARIYWLSCANSKEYFDYLGEEDYDTNVQNFLRGCGFLLRSIDDKL